MQGAVVPSKLTPTCYDLLSAFFLAFPSIPDPPFPATPCHHTNPFMPYVTPASKSIS